VRETVRKSFYKNGYLLIIAAWLYTISFIFSNYSFYTTSPDRVQRRLESYIKKSERQFQDFIEDTAVLKPIVQGAEPQRALEYVNESLGLYVYTRNDVGNLLLLYWNNHEVIPEEKDLTRLDGKYFSSYPNGEFEFIKKTLYLDGKQVVVAGMVPIHRSFFLKNNYLRDEFVGIKNIENLYSIVPNNALVYVRNGDGKVLFGLEKKSRSHNDNPGWLSLTLRVIAIIFVLMFFQVTAHDVVQKRGWIKGFLLLLGLVTFFRFLSYVFPFPFQYRKLDLFDPGIYASNSLHPSLGDLVINMMLIFWLVSFFKFFALTSIRNLKKVRGKRAWLMTFVLAVVIVTMSFTSAGIIRSLITDSKISFDVVNFFSLNIYSLLGFIILCFIVLSFFHLTHIVLLLMRKAGGVPLYARYLIVVICGLFFLSFKIHTNVVVSNLIVLIWLIAYLYLMEYRWNDMFIPLIRSSFFLVWLIFFAASTAALIIFQYQKVEFEQRKKTAEKLAEQADPFRESFMSISTVGISNDFLQNNLDRLKAESSNKLIKDSIINQNFFGFLNKYDIRLYTYDSAYRPLYNEDSVSYEVFTNIISTQTKRTGVPNVYYYEGTEGYSFLYQKEIRDSFQVPKGYLFILSRPKKYTTEALYPELFKQVKDINTEMDLSYAYAVYDKGILVTHSGDYNFMSKLPKDAYPKQDYIEKRNGEDNELWYNAGSNKLVIVVKSGSTFFAAITLFAYLFGAFLFIIVMFQLVQYLIKARFRWRRIKSGFTLNIRTQIQSTIIFISIFSFLVIGIATISFYINRFNQTNRERLVKSIQIMADEIEKQVARHDMFDDVVKIYDLGANTELERSINAISTIHNVDVNFYDLNGNLKVSTQPYIYKKNILSSLMEPKAYYQLHYNKSIQYIQQEKVGRFSYLSVYIPIRDEEGQPYAYINIPYLNSQKELNQEISNFLVTLINLNAFIFVVAGAIALMLTNRIANSFTLIGSKMKDINLRKVNEEIVWHTNDEIGTLVNEYNKMVKKLEESAQALAKSEREGAWREMARQVAHEIKNPLTPMKLSIQYLQRAIAEKNGDMQALSQKVASTLVEQIDQLAKIASDFSQFANIGNVKSELFDVNGVINSLINLYNTNEKLNITWNKPQKEVLIDADRSQINRLFTNLFQNAIEASNGKELVNIVITEEVNANKLLVSIKDEGVGIPVEQQDKIFTPNFTTKSSGTGLGLAMCKGIVEKANGRIWFETREGVGTTFYVLLPVAGLPA
jgi:two-component system, NtrC family, nitrogen regulation sensor histidine kinase NtrY